MRKLIVIGFVALTGCQDAVTPEGCKIFYGEMYAYTEACVAAYHAEKARQAGQPVTRCYQTVSGMTCVGG